MTASGIAGTMDEALTEGNINMTFSGYSVIDFETTGLSPEYHHRVIEVAVVHVDPNGAIEGRYETVLNPHRDLGPVHIHGLRGRDVMEAPTFEEIAGDFVKMLRDRVLVAHNASFEARFLRSELQHARSLSPVANNEALCTMNLAHLFLPGSRRALADCCAAYDIALENAHEALADAHATAQLLGAYLQQDSNHPVWGRYREYAERWQWPSLPASDTPWVSRTRKNSVARSFLHDAMALLPDINEPDDGQRTYLAQLDQALGDGFITLAEADSLHDLAAESGLDERARTMLHAQYFDDLVAAAWADGVLTDDELTQIDRVGELLGIAGETRRAALVAPVAEWVEEALTGVHRDDAAETKVSSPRIVLEPGALVVLTGEMEVPRSYYETLLTEHGYIPWSGVTKKVSLVVAADPDSLSGKARKAHDYGIPVVGVETLIELMRAA
ncbi:exonuclease domain-containing protein [Paramicrobacterium chengjingii]|uniref:DNA polymerase III subunit epsilon n=1 Tax=Paramicrobacterium chengjingii TaxID=2769067 RepID=A0ABX6YHS2_9MICO|nr:exonuclease domain-containing protein [Microbacterium chengjingii]QPZ38255.1 DNA polymerase III subunit epsilon [Microbacterium chengjingii]